MGWFCWSTRRAGSDVHLMGPNDAKMAVKEEEEEEGGGEEGRWVGQQ